MNRLPLRRIAWLAAACALAAGCGSLLDPRPDETRFYVLDPTAAPEPAEETLASEGASIGLGPVRIPDYLRRPEIVTRTLLVWRRGVSSRTSITWIPRSLASYGALIGLTGPSRKRSRKPASAAFATGRTPYSPAWPEHPDD